ncbi:Synaptonemal complex central element protein 1 [Manis javanica]|nr:Synaptonemal complex central element protein 1 [Manis javanica]
MEAGRSGSAANHALWKKFDEACNTAHKVVESWHDKLRTETTQSKAQRLALIEEIKAWHSSPPAKISRVGRVHCASSLNVGVKAGTSARSCLPNCNPSSSRPWPWPRLRCMPRKTSLQRRHAMIDEATARGAAPNLRIDAVKALQQRWQAEAQAVPRDRKHEQSSGMPSASPRTKPSTARAPRGAPRAAAVALSDHDRRVLEASQGEPANTSGDVQQSALRWRPWRSAAWPCRCFRECGPASTGNPCRCCSGFEESEAAGAGAPVVAVRGDDRPGMKKEEGGARAARPGDRRDGGRGRDGRDGRDSRDSGRFSREPREERGPRLADPAFRAQREALGKCPGRPAQLAAQAHGEALTQLMAAWGSRDASQMPAAQQLGSRVLHKCAVPGRRPSARPLGDAGEALLRLGKRPPTFPHLRNIWGARRALQPQPLTRQRSCSAGNLGQRCRPGYRRAMMPGAPSAERAQATAAQVMHGR